VALDLGAFVEKGVEIATQRSTRSPASPPHGPAEEQGGYQPLARQEM
jgi:hypothetical protein